MSTEDKTLEELKNQILIKDELKKHREESDSRYAKILVERVLWSLLALAFIGLASYYFNQIFLK